MGPPPIAMSTPVRSGDVLNDNDKTVPGSVFLILFIRVDPMDRTNLSFGITEFVLWFTEEIHPLYVCPVFMGSHPESSLFSRINSIQFSVRVEEPMVGV